MSNLRKKSVLITRPRDKAEAMAQLVRKNGGVPVIFPTIQIIETDNWSETDSAISNLTSYDWIVFTSVHGVKFFIQRLSEISALKKLQSLSIACVGSKTAQALETMSITVDLIPDQYTAESLLIAFQSLTARPKNVLLVKGDKSKETLSTGLNKINIPFKQITVYQNISPIPDSMEKLLAPFNGNAQQVLTFTSPSTYQNFCHLIEENGLHPSTVLETNVIAVIGPVTADAIKETGYVADIVPRQSTIEHMIEAIVTYINTPEPNVQSEDIA